MERDIREFDRERARRREEAEQFLPTEASVEGRVLAAGPADGLAWDMDGDRFLSAAIELLRRDDALPLRFLLRRLPVDVEALLHRGGPLLEGALDRAACLAALFLFLDEPRWFAATLEALKQAYARGFSQRSGIVEPERLWVLIVERVLAVGAIAVRLQEWTAVRELALAQPDGVPHASWIRHAQAAALRPHAVLGTGAHDGELGQWVARAAEKVRAEPRLRPDLGVADERILDSVCQFDALALLAVMAWKRDRNYYINFPASEMPRAEPVLARIIEDERTRDQICPFHDRELADAIRWLGGFGQAEAENTISHSVFRDPRVLAFLGVYR